MIYKKVYRNTNVLGPALVSVLHSEWKKMAVCSVIRISNAAGMLIYLIDTNIYALPINIIFTPY
jgi:hypothetical protein